MLVWRAKIYKIRHVEINIFPRYNLVSDPKAIQVQGEVSCFRCGGAVFHAEALYAKGRPFHQTCSTCVSCNKRLDSLSLNNGPDGEIYCKGCHENHFGSFYEITQTDYYLSLIFLLQIINTYQRMKMEVH